MRTITVHVIDDDDGILDCLKESFERLKMPCRYYLNAEDCDPEEHDIVLTEVNMPNFGKILETKCKNLITMSGNHELHPDFPKPFNFDYLAEFIKNKAAKITKVWNFEDFLKYDPSMREFIEVNRKALIEDKGNIRELILGLLGCVSAHNDQTVCGRCKYIQNGGNCRKRDFLAWLEIQDA